MEAEKQKSENDDLKHAIFRNEASAISNAVIGTSNDGCNDQAENTSDNYSKTRNYTQSKEQYTWGEDSDADRNSDSDSDKESDNEGLSDYEKLRLERIRRNQEYLSRLGLEEQKSKWKPQKRARKKRDDSTKPEEETTHQQRKASLRTKTEQVRYSDLSIKEILGHKPRALESQPRKRKLEKEIQHRMERYIYREFQRIQAERNAAQKQIDLLIRRTEKEEAFWGKIIEQKEHRSQLSQARQLELEEERALFKGLTLRELLKQVDNRMPELLQAAQKYDQEIEEARRNGENEAEKRKKQLQIQQLCALDIYPIVLKNAYSILDAILYGRFVDSGTPQRRSNRATNSVAAPSRPFPTTILERIPDGPAKSFIKWCDFYDGQTVSHHRGGWISPFFAATIDRTWPDRKDIYVPQVGDLVLYYPVGHGLFLAKHPDEFGETDRARTPLWNRAVTEKDPANPWCSDSWLDSAKAGSARYPLICRVTETHFEFPPGDPYAMSDGGDGSTSWKKKDKALTKSRRNTMVRLAISLRPLSSVLPELPQLPPPFSVVWFPSEDAKPFLNPFQDSYTIYHSLSEGSLVTADGIQVVVQQFAMLKGKSTRLNQYLPSLSEICRSNKRSIQESLEDEIATLSTEHGITSHELRPIAELLQQTLELNNVDGRYENFVSGQKITIFALIRSTLPLWQGVSCVPKSNKRIEMSLSPWELQQSTSHSAANVLEKDVQDLIDFVIDRTVAEHPKADQFHEDLTEDEAPSYLCAVPVPMSTSVVLRKLHCRYYRSINSLLNDFNIILGNCLLYNSPDAPVVADARSFVSCVHYNMIDAIDQTEQLYENIGFRIPSTIRLGDNPTLFSKPSATLSNNGSLERRWMYDGTLWTPQSGDVVLYSITSHQKFVDFHAIDLGVTRCQTLDLSAGERGDVEALVLWTKPCFPYQRRKHSPGTFYEDAPLIEVGLQLSEDVNKVYWRPCLLNDAEPHSCGCGCPKDFLRPANTSACPGLSTSDVHNIVLSLTALKEKFHGQTPFSVFMSKKAVKKGSVPVAFPLSSVEGSLSDEPSSPISDSNGLALYGFIVGARTNEGSYPLPELCLDLVLRCLKGNHYRSRGALENDIIESFVNAISTRLARLSKIERCQISMAKISLNYAQKSEVNKEEEHFMNVVRKIRELHAAALASAACIECAVVLLASTVQRQFQKEIEVDTSREAARRCLGALLSAIARGPALNFKELSHVPAMTIRVKCAGKTITHCKNVGICRYRMVEMEGKTRRMGVCCEGRSFAYECCLDVLDESNNQEPSHHIEATKVVAVDCICFSADELERNSRAAQFFFGRPGKSHACARCQVKGRSFLDCRVRRHHSNIDFNWKTEFQAFGSIDGLIDSLLPYSKALTASRTSNEHHETANSEETHAESLATLNEIYRNCADILEKANAIGTEIRHLSHLPIRLSKQFLEESFPIDPSDGRYMYCIICGLSGDLFCCEKCPNVFHTKCLGLDSVPAGEWVCEECKSTSDGILNRVPFGRAEINSSQLEQLEMEVNSLRSMRADRLKRQTGGVSRKATDQDVEDDVASESERKSLSKVDREFIIQRRGRPPKIRDAELNQHSSQADKHQALDDESKTGSHLQHRHVENMSTEVHPQNPLLRKVRRGRGRPQKIEPERTVQSACSPRSEKRIRPYGQHKRGRPPKRSQVSEPSPKRFRVGTLSANAANPSRRNGRADGSSSAKLRVSPNGPGFFKQEGESQMKTHQSASVVNIPDYPQPGKFVECLVVGTGSAAQKEEKMPDFARRSARLSR